jgi:hypothetical protein
MSASSWFQQFSRRIVLASCVVTCVLLIALIILSATGASTQGLLPILGSVVVLSVFIVLTDLRRRHSRLHHELEKAQRAIELLAQRSDSLATVQQELRRLATMGTEVTAALGSLDKRATDLKLAVDADSTAVGWLELAKTIALEPQFAEHDVDPWVVVEVRAHLEQLPRAVKMVVLGGRFTALLCALAAPPETSVVMLTDDLAIKELVDAESHRRNLGSRLEVRFAALEYGVQGGIAGYAYSAKALNGVSDVPLIVIAGPPWDDGPGARDAVTSSVIRSLALRCRIIAADFHHPDFPAMLDAWRSQLAGTASLNRISARGVDIAFDRVTT